MLLQFQVNPVPVEQFKQIAVQRSRLFLPVFGLGNLIALAGKCLNARITVQHGKRRLDFAAPLFGDFKQIHIHAALETFLAVALVFVVQSQSPQFHALRQIGLNFKVQRDDVFGIHAFFRQIFAEFFHIVGVDAENIERFQLFQIYTVRTLARQAALERIALSLEAHATTEKLDNLAAFAFAHVQKPHGGNAPARPAFGKFFRADQEIDIPRRRINRIKQAT